MSLLRRKAALTLLSNVHSASDGGDGDDDDDDDDDDDYGDEDGDGDDDDDNDEEVNWLNGIVTRSCSSIRDHTSGMSFEICGYPRRIGLM